MGRKSLTRREGEDPLASRHSSVIDHALIGEPTGAAVRDAMQREVRASLDQTENFHELDNDGDGFISTREINHASRDPNLSSDLIEITILLKRKLSEVEEFANDEFLDENDGATINDLAQYERVPSLVGKGVGLVSGRVSPEELNRLQRLVELSARLDAHFDKLDRDLDGYISESDLDSLLSDPKIAPELVPLVILLHQNRSSLQHLSRDEWALENGGVTRQDIFALLESAYSGRSGELRAFTDSFLQDWLDAPTIDDLQTMQSDMTNYFNELENKFHMLDLDGDGFIAQSELDRLMKWRKLAPDLCALVISLRKAKSVVEETSNDEFGDENDGITLADLRELRKDSTTIRILCKDRLERRISTAAEMLRNKTRIDAEFATDVSDKLYGDEANPEDSIYFSAVRQGEIGDCYFLAPLAALALQRPQEILKMIKSNSDGSYTVTFPGINQSFIVAPPTACEQVLFARAGKMGYWVNVLEKAFGQYQRERYDSQSVIDNEGADGGGDTAEALEALTGKKATRVPTSYGERVEKLLLDVTSKNRVVTAVTGPWPRMWDPEAPHVLPTHAFAVVGYDPVTKMVELWDQTGHGDGTQGLPPPKLKGYFKIPLDKFCKLFQSIAVED